MPPVISRPLLEEVQTMKPETRPVANFSKSLDLCDIITHAVTSLKLQSNRKKSKPKRKYKFPCGICEKSVNKNQKSIYCDNCGLRIHKSCEELTDGEFQKLVEEEDDIPWTCQTKHNAEVSPLGLLSKFELLDLNGIDLPSYLQTLPSLETRSKLVNLPNLNDFDIDENIISTINSKYYSVDEINKVQLSKQHFSVFHTNIRSLSKHHDTLHTQLSMINIPFDVIGISETKEQIDDEFITNVGLRGYSMYSQPSESLCDGCAIYVNSQLDNSPLLNWINLKGASSGF